VVFAYIYLKKAVAGEAGGGGEGAKGCFLQTKWVSSLWEVAGGVGYTYSESPSNDQLSDTGLGSKHLRVQNFWTRFGFWALPGPSQAISFDPSWGPGPDPKPENWSKLGTEMDSPSSK